MQRLLPQTSPNRYQEQEEEKQKQQRVVQLSLEGGQLRTIKVQ